MFLKQIANADIKLKLLFSVKYHVLIKLVELVSHHHQLRLKHKLSPLNNNLRYSLEVYQGKFKKQSLHK
jgi:hypothetical protein